MFESLPRKLDGKRSVKRLLIKGCLFNHDNGNKISCLYANAKSLRNKFAEIKVYVSLEKPDIIFITETWIKIYVHNNKFSQKDIILKDK